MVELSVQAKENKVILGEERTNITLNQNVSTLSCFHFTLSLNETKKSDEVFPSMKM